MLSRIDPIVQDPVVGYRLDSGEPGVANPTRASRSAYTVVGQESRNRARLRSEAMKEGRQVVLLKTEYKVRRVGSYTVPVGGLTTVVTRERPEAAQPLSPLQRPAPATEQTKGETPETQEITQLHAEQRQLETEKRRLERGPEQGAAYQAARAEQRIDEIDRRLEQIEDELRQLGVATASIAGNPGLAIAANGFAATLDVTGQLLDVLV